MCARNFEGEKRNTLLTNNFFGLSGKLAMVN